ncbi:interleukin-1 receptor type 2 [Cololabis saira]|uniref:interleukin-1 receptor type 2 n=1 Tax=Cololabis saira TaxID=129043 RepID=UPI002AD324EF|nr:interleukin-1 receptor type 2 [Cololabis saira]
MQAATMVCLLLMFAAVIITCVHGRRPPLPPLPMKDGCFQVDPDVEVFRLEGEAVILHFPMFLSVLHKRKIVPPTAKYLLSKSNGSAGLVFQEEGRVQQHHAHLWFLPAQASDSGEYTCTYRNDTYCVTGSIKLHVYESSSADMAKLYYPWTVMVGEERKLTCPSLESFNSTSGLIQWYKDSSPSALRPGRLFHEDGGTLSIPEARRAHAGVYTCRLSVLLNNQHYNVSRSILLSVQGSDPAIMTTTSTSGAGLIGSSTHTTADAPLVKPPVIISPLNGTIYESSHGSGLELFCQVLTECHMADSTVVTWLVDGQSVESSYLDKRALQGGRRVTRVSQGCEIELRLIIVTISDEDVKTEVKCVTQNKGGRQEVVAQLRLEDSTSTWLVVAAVGVSCFLAVVSVFLYVLCKPKRTKNADYFLARQNSSFSF